MASIPQHYKNNGTLVDYQQYTADYFSGCSVNLFFGDRFIDEVVALEFTMQEQLLSIYGYASYTYDAMLHGQRLVTGSFKINFVESGYLINTLNNIATEEYSRLNSVVQENVKNLTSEEFMKLYKDADAKSLSDFSDKYEEAIWGIVGDSIPVDSTLLKDKTKPYFNSYKKPNDIGFDILITYSPGIAIPTVFDKSGSSNTTAAFTIESLNDVHIYSHSKVIDPSGQPIQEVYQFMAKDWNNSIKR
ncbi:MAG TPA: hypothetical protein VK190_03185 [Pseudoneobacillus sp.]|jgi:hypothetical protein|nr:hypothetical protein [Pseudoneobacillus sp.]